MAKVASSDQKRSVELLEDLLITTLGIARVPQLEIRKIVRVDMNRVNRIVKHIKK